MKKRTDVSQLRETLIFGQSYAGGAPFDPMAAVAALPDDAAICDCNGVCKGQITAAITTNGYRTLEDNQRVEFEVVQGDRGPQADQVRPL